MSQTTDNAARRRRVSDLIGLPAKFANGTSAGYVNDARLAHTDRVRGLTSLLATEGLVVGAHRNGSLLGYDRRRDQGPAIIRAVVRPRHRRSGHVPWTSVARVDFEGGLVQLSVNSLEELGDP